MLEDVIGILEQSQIDDIPVRVLRLPGGGRARPLRVVDSGRGRDDLLQPHPPAGRVGEVERVWDLDLDPTVR